MRQVSASLRGGVGPRVYRGGMPRLCSKVACGNEAVATLTYDYADAMAVLGPLSIRHEPHSYDLCERHAEKLSAPQGWQVVRHVVMDQLGA